MYNIICTPPEHCTLCMISPPNDRRRRRDINRHRTPRVVLFRILRRPRRFPSPHTTYTLSRRRYITLEVNKRTHTHTHIYIRTQTQYKYILRNIIRIYMYIYIKLYCVRAAPKGVHVTAWQLSKYAKHTHTRGALAQTRYVWSPDATQRPESTRPPRVIPSNVI